MAESTKSVEQRVAKLEADVGDIKGAIVQMTTLFVEHTQRVDAGFKQVWEELRLQGIRMEGLTQRMDGLTQRMDGLMQRMDGLTERMDGLTQRMDGVNERLDRLIAVTMKERTAGTERLAAIEERLSKLEARVGG